MTNPHRTAPPPPGAPGAAAVRPPAGGRRRRGRWQLATLAVAGLLLAGCVTTTEATGRALQGSGEAVTEPVGALLAAVSEDHPFIVHRTDTCGCCGAYEEILEAAGVNVQPSIHDDLTHVRAAFGVPEHQASCHTGQIAGYAIEGHVPLAAIERLLTERPEVDGIALAGMPAGSPGMPGPKQTPLVVTLIDGGQVVGELGRY
jgi:hypothetical protein